MKVKFVHVYPDRLNGLYDYPEEKIAGLTLEQSQERYANKILMSMQTIITKAIALESQAEKHTDSENKPILMLATPEFFYYTPKNIIISDQIFLNIIVKGLKNYVKDLPNLVLFHFGTLCIEPTGQIEYLEPPPVIKGGYQHLAWDPNMPQGMASDFLAKDKQQTNEKKFFNLALYGQCGSEEGVYYYSKQYPYSEDPFLLERTQVIIKGQNNFFVPLIKEGIGIGNQFLICFDTQFPETQKNKLMQSSNLPEHGFTHIVGQGAVIEEETSFYTLSILADYRSGLKNSDNKRDSYRDPWPISTTMLSYPPYEMGTLKESIREFYARKLKTIEKQLEVTTEVGIIQSPGSNEYSQTGSGMNKSSTGIEKVDLKHLKESLRPNKTQKP